MSFSKFPTSSIDFGFPLDASGRLLLLNLFNNSIHLNKLVSILHHLLELCRKNHVIFLWTQVEIRVVFVSP